MCLPPYCRVSSVTNESVCMDSLSTITTTVEAFSYLDRHFRTQLTDSEVQKAPPNTAITGDARAKAAFGALLVLVDQREFFLRLISDRRFWPRLRSLVGSPPYIFLRPEDDGLLNASGINRHRSRIAPNTTCMSSSSDFGLAHFIDEHQRLYKIVAKQKPTQSVPWLGMESGARVVVDVRLKHTPQDIRVAIAQGSTEVRNQLVFPRPGDTLSLTLVSQLNKGNDEVTISARVECGRQKSRLASIARLVLKIA